MKTIVAAIAIIRRRRCTMGSPLAGNLTTFRARRWAAGGAWRRPDWSRNAGFQPAPEPPKWRRCVQTWTRPGAAGVVHRFFRTWGPASFDSSSFALRPKLGLRDQNRAGAY